MSETPDKPEDQPSGQPQPDEEESVELREVSEDELKQVLEAHEAWLGSDGKEGRQADLSRANLQEADLSHVNLQKADLEEANLQGANLNKANLQGAKLHLANLWRASLFGANLQGAKLWMADLQGANLTVANLQGAILFGANLQGANLIGANLQGVNLGLTNFEGREATEDGEALETASLSAANLRDADLSDAKLSDVTGLLTHKLAGANLSNAKLPNDIKGFEGLRFVEETSKNARKIFFGLLLGCVYSWLTIATTTDARLLTNSASSPLPIIQTAIPIAGFYWVAPVILLGLYFYFHLYLQRLWIGLATLPAVFPDGKPLDQKAYPWLLNGLVRAHFTRLRDDRPPISRLENFISIVLAWWIVPLTLGLFWLRYLPRHEWVGIWIHIGLLVVSVALAIIFYHSAATTLRGDERQQFRWKTPWRDRRTYQRAAIALVAVVFSLLSLAAIQGNPWTRLAFPPLATADLREADVSTKPVNWRGKEEDIPSVKGARLQGSDLRYADAKIAFLVKANLGGGNLQGADLSGANLEKADLWGANLQGADLWGANLQGARLYEANLQGAKLQGAKLQGAKLVGANLRAAKLPNADLQGANLLGANLEGADLEHAKNLSQKQLDQACGDAKTKLPYYLKDYKMKRCPKESK